MIANQSMCTNSDSFHDVLTLIHITGPQKTKNVGHAYRTFGYGHVVHRQPNLPVHIHF